MRRAVLVVAVGSVATLLACNAIIGLSGDYDVNPADGGTAPGVDARTTSDGTTPTSDGTTPPAADTGVPDSGPEGDACPADIESTIDAGTAMSETFNPGTCPNTLPSGEIICWDFTGTEDASTKWGWNEMPLTQGATLDVEGQTGSPARNLHALVTDAAAPPSNAGLWFTDWNSLGTPGVIDPLTFPRSSTIIAHFHFQVLQADRPMVVGGWRINSVVYGISVFPTPCGGRPRVGSNFNPPPDTYGGAFIDLKTWYYASVSLTRNTDNSYTGSVSVGTQSLSQTQGPTGIPNGGEQADADSLVPTGIGVGLFNGATNQGATQVIVDDVTGNQQ